MKLSVVIPAQNEEQSISDTVRDLHSQLVEARIEHEILVINDNSKDGTAEVVRRLLGEIGTLRCLNNTPPCGFGLAVRKGFEECTGDAVAVFMADGSDLPCDLIRFLQIMSSRKADCVFGTRFSDDSTLIGYPLVKLILNRSVNTLIRVLFGLRYNDVTNAFKLYHKDVINELRPLLLSRHFNLTVELPLRAIIRGYGYEVMPNAWVNRKHGESKLKMKEMGSHYMRTILFCLVEKWLYRIGSIPMNRRTSPSEGQEPQGVQERDRK